MYLEHALLSFILSDTNLYYLENQLWKKKVIDNAKVQILQLYYVIEQIIRIKTFF